jgi:hypothetical protein
MMTMMLGFRDWPKKINVIGLPGPILWFRKYFRQKILRKKMAIFVQSFRRKLAKIAENCDHDITP